MVHRHERGFAETELHSKDNRKDTLMGIDVYGADWCGDCTRAKMLLDRHNVTYNWIDTDADEVARAKAIEISGLQKIPVIVFPNGEFLSEPSNPQIEEQLKANGLA